MEFARTVTLPEQRCQPRMSVLPHRGRASRRVAPFVVHGNDAFEIFYADDRTESIKTTSAGRRFSASRSTYGNGTMMTSYALRGSEVFMGLLVGSSGPLRKRGEWIVRIGATECVVDQHAALSDTISKGVSRANAECIRTCFGSTVWLFTETREKAVSVRARFMSVIGLTVLRCASRTAVSCYCRLRP